MHSVNNVIYRYGYSADCLAQYTASMRIQTMYEFAQKYNFNLSKNTKKQHLSLFGWSLRMAFYGHFDLKLSLVYNAHDSDVILDLFQPF